jgi:hypothetical protein
LGNLHRVDQTALGFGLACIFHAITVLTTLHPSIRLSDSSSLLKLINPMLPILLFFAILPLRFAPTFLMWTSRRIHPPSRLKQASQFPIVKYTYVQNPGAIPGHGHHIMAQTLRPVDLSQLLSVVPSCNVGIIGSRILIQIE